jgi:hypothetical protein
MSQGMSGLEARLREVTGTSVSLLEVCQHASGEWFERATVMKTKGAPLVRSEKLTPRSGGPLGSVAALRFAPLSRTLLVIVSRHDPQPYIR